MRVKTCVFLSVRVSQWLYTVDRCVQETEPTTNANTAGFFFVSIVSHPDTLLLLFSCGRPWIPAFFTIWGSECPASKKNKPILCCPYCIASCLSSIAFIDNHPKEHRRTGNRKEMRQNQLALGPSFCMFVCQYILAKQSNLLLGWVWRKWRGNHYIEQNFDGWMQGDRIWMWHFDNTVWCSDCLH
jgi:hypothetical protein